MTIQLTVVTQISFLSNGSKWPVSGYDSQKEVTIETKYRSLNVHCIASDFWFVLFKRFLTYDNKLIPYQPIIMTGIRYGSELPCQ
jgi:hypothetical protein